MKLIAVLVIAGALATGRGVWEAPIPGRFEASLRGDSRASAMTVLLHDQTGLVRAMTAGRRPAADTVDEMLPSSLVTIDFMGGYCDDFAELTFRPIDGRFRLTISVVSTLLHGGNDCFFLIGYRRSVTLELWQPIAPGSVDVEQRQRS